MMRSPRKKNHLHPHQPEHMSVGGTPREGQNRTGGYGRQQARSHILLAPIRAQVVTASITGVPVWGISGPIAQVCACNIDAIERVNTIWGAAALDRDQSSPPTAEEKNLDLLARTQAVCSQIPLTALQFILPLKAHIHLLPCSFQTV